MDSYYRLYPDCKLVHGRVRSAIYDLTRGDIHLIPNSLASMIKDGTIDLRHNSTRAQELITYLDSNELGEYGMSDDIKDISEVFDCPSIIANAIIEIDIKGNLPLKRIAYELSDLLCESIYLHFITNCDIDYILDIAACFETLSYRSIEIGILYQEGIMCDVEQIARCVSLCSKIIVSKAPFNQTSIIGRDVALRFTKSVYSCDGQFSKRDYSKWVVPKLPLYLESLRYNNCLHKKVFIDCIGDIRNCPASSVVYGNVYNRGDLSLIVQHNDFQRLWSITNDMIAPCCDCELRYACQHCIFDNTVCEHK